VLVDLRKLVGVIDGVAHGATPALPLEHALLGSCPDDATPRLPHLGWMTDDVGMPFGCGSFSSGRWGAAQLTRRPAKTHGAVLSRDGVGSPHVRRPGMSFYWLAAAYAFEFIVAVGFVVWVKLND
jgi:hypothetical protein